MHLTDTDAWRLGLVSGKRGRICEQRRDCTVRRIVNGIELVAPWPPSINHYWRRVGPRTLISREGRAFRESVVTACQMSGIDALEGRLHVSILATPPDARRRDLDNILKSLLDAMEHGGVYADDGQIDSMELIRCKPGESRVEVRVVVIA